MERYFSYKKARIYPMDDGNYQLAYRDCWISAFFDSVQACKDAIPYIESGVQIEELWTKLNPVLPNENIRCISVDDIKALNQRA